MPCLSSKAYVGGKTAAPWPSTGRSRSRRCSATGPFRLFAQSRILSAVTVLALLISLLLLDIDDTSRLVLLAWPVQAQAEATNLNSWGRATERRVGKECRSRWSPY